MGGVVDSIGGAIGGGANMLGFGGTGGVLGFMDGGNNPVSKGYGIADPTEFQEYNTGPGLQQGQAQANMQGLDMTRQGAAEQFQQQNSGQFNAPGQSSQYWQQNQNRVAQGGPNLTDNTGQRYQQFDQAKSAAATPANLDPYYDNAKRRAQEEIDQAMASRGAYGSSAATDRIAEAFTDLNAEQANREADYGLQRSADQRSWEGLGMEGANRADMGSLARNQNAQSWLGMGAGMAGAADAAEVSRFGAGMQGALGAQDAQRARGQDYFNNQFQMGNALAGMSGEAYNNMLDMDSQLMDGAMGMELGLATEAVNQSRANQQRQKDDASWAIDSAGGVMSLGGM